MKRFLSVILAVGLLGFTGCKTTDPYNGEDPEKDTNYYVNLFAYNVMQVYYLWVEEVADGFKDWTYGTEPKQKVRSMRYKENGKEVDKWTTLTESYSDYLGSLTGNTKSLGFDFNLYYADSSKKKIKAAVTFTYANSPARKAGLKRGDSILTLDGQEMTPDNYSALLLKTIYGGGTVKLGLESGKEVSLTAVQMYEDPVHTVTTMTVGGKRIGYLHFSSFTMDACRDLESAFRTFKDYGIEELVLDLRYNGGGYTITSTVLASMIAPLEEVTAGSVYSKDVYNSTLSEVYEGERETCFADEFDIKSSSGKETYKVHPAKVNPGIRKLWVITTDDTASASELLICGLNPYMDLSTVGERSYGKFCGGYTISTADFFNSIKEEVDYEEALEKSRDWGIYVMVFRYSDKYGQTLSMPDGIPASYEVRDNPFDGHELGDPEETMLSAVLALSTGTVPKASITPMSLEPVPEVHRPGFGVLINDKELW